MRSALRSSRYYSMRGDSITIQAQTSRSRTANTDENHHKLVEEIHRMYREQVPAATSEKKIKKHEEMYASIPLEPDGGVSSWLWG